jgi:hypothetical protein
MSGILRWTVLTHLVTHLCGCLRRTLVQLHLGQILL